MSSRPMQMPPQNAAGGGGSGGAWAADPANLWRVAAGTTSPALSSSSHPHLGGSFGFPSGSGGMGAMLSNTAPLMYGAPSQSRPGRAGVGILPSPPPPPRTHSQNTTLQSSDVSDISDGDEPPERIDSDFVHVSSPGSGDRSGLTMAGGQGNFGSIYCMRQKLDGRRYAVKRIERAIMGRQDGAEKQLEAQILAKCNHPNVVRYFTTWVETKGNVCIVMEWCDGDATKYHRNPPGEETLLDLAAQVAAGIDYIHRLGYLHMDIKFENILLKSKGRARGLGPVTYKLCDFGVARVLAGTDDGAEPQDGDGRYIDPLVLNPCGRDTLLAADTFSLGMSLYEAAREAPLLSAEFGFVRSGVDGVFTTLREKGLSEEFAGIVRGMIAASPAARPSPQDVVVRAKKQLLVLRGRRSKNVATTGPGSPPSYAAPQPPGLMRGAAGGDSLRSPPAGGGGGPASIRSPGFAGSRGSGDLHNSSSSSGSANAALLPPPPPRPPHADAHAGNAQGDAAANANTTTPCTPTAASTSTPAAPAAAAPAGFNNPNPPVPVPVPAVAAAAVGKAGGDRDPPTPVAKPVSEDNTPAAAGTPKPAAPKPSLDAPVGARSPAAMPSLMRTALGSGGGTAPALRSPGAPGGAMLPTYATMPAHAHAATTGHADDAAAPPVIPSLIKTALFSGGAGGDAPAEGKVPVTPGAGGAPMLMKTGLMGLVGQQKGGGVGGGSIHPVDAARSPGPGTPVAAGTPSFMKAAASMSTPALGTAALPRSPGTPSLMKAGLGIGGASGTAKSILKSPGTPGGGLGGSLLSSMPVPSLMKSATLGAGDLSRSPGTPSLMRTGMLCSSAPGTPGGGGGLRPAYATVPGSGDVGVLSPAPGGAVPSLMRTAMLGGAVAKTTVALGVAGGTAATPADADAVRSPSLLRSPGLKSPGTPGRASACLLSGNSNSNNNNSSSDGGLRTAYAAVPAGAEGPKLPMPSLMHTALSVDPDADDDLLPRYAAVPVGDGAGAGASEKLAVSMPRLMRTALSGFGDSTLAGGGGPHTADVGDWQDSMGDPCGEGLPSFTDAADAPSTPPTAPALPAATPTPLQSMADRMNTDGAGGGGVPPKYAAVPQGIPGGDAPGTPVPSLMRAALAGGRTPIAGGGLLPAYAAAPAAGEAGSGTGTSTPPTTSPAVPSLIKTYLDPHRRLSDGTPCQLPSYTAAAAADDRRGSAGTGSGVCSPLFASGAQRKPADASDADDKTAATTPLDGAAGGCGARVRGFSQTVRPAVH